MQRYIFLLTILLVSSLIKAQTTFQVTFGGNSSQDLAQASQQTTDGGFILVGHTTSFGAGGYDFHLIKTDGAGNLQWSKTYGGSGDDLAWDVQQTMDGGYIMVGSTNSFGVPFADVYVVKTDANGNLQWSGTYGDAFRFDEGRDIQQTTDGGYIIAGSTQPNSTRDVYVIKIDATGVLIWTRAIGGSQPDFGYAIAQNFTGEYYAYGITNSFGAGLQDLYLIKLNSAGTVLWTKTYGGAGNEFSGNMQVAINGDIIMVGLENSFGSATSDIYLTRTDGNGNVIWSKSYETNNIEVGYFVQQMMNGNFIVVGQTQTTSSTSFVYLLNVSSSGTLQWEKTYGIANPMQTSAGISVRQNTDAGFIIAGQIRENNTSGLSDYYLIRTNSTGMSGCNEGNLSPTTINCATVTATGGTNLTIGTSTTPTTIVNTPNPPFQILCQFKADIDELYWADNFLVYPNPAKNVLYIRQENFTPSEFFFALRDLTGRKISETIVNGNQTIPIENIMAGIYVYSISLRENILATGKLVIE